MARVNNLNLLCCEGRKTVSLINTKTKSQQRFPTKRFAHPTERNPALTVNLNSHSRRGLPKLAEIPARKKANPLQRNPTDFAVEIIPISFPEFYP